MSESPARPSDRFRVSLWRGPVLPGDMGVSKTAHSRIQELRPALVAEDARVTESIIDTDGAWREGQDLIAKTRAELKTVWCTTLLEWSLELRARQDQGHTLFPCEDPKARCLGFVDHTENILFNIGIVKIHECPPEILKALEKGGGDAPPPLSSYQNRRLLISGSLDGWDFGWSGDFWSVEQKAEWSTKIAELCALIESEQKAEEEALEDLSGNLPRPVTLNPGT